MFGFCCGAVHSETAQSLRGRTQSIQEELWIGILAEVLSREIEQRISLCLWRILVEFEAVFHSFLFSLCAEPWRPA